MARLSQWLAGARPRTLPAAVAPVAIGTGAAAPEGPIRWDAAALALVVAMALQVGVNYANDYSDGVRGTDCRRVGPVRLVGQGLAAPAQVRRAAFAAFGVAAVVGLVLVVLTGTLWLIGVGAAAIVAAWFYTGGSRPYGYAGFGEVFVFLFFGLVATLGTTYTQIRALTPAAWAGAVGVGCLSCAILMVNNIRDIPGDRLAGKRTLAVRLGDAPARRAYLGLVAAAGIAALVAGLRHPPAWAGLLAFGWAVPAVRTVRSGAQGPALIPVLAATGRVTLAYGLFLAAGLFASG